METDLVIQDDIDEVVTEVDSESPAATVQTESALEAEADADADDDASAAELPEIEVDEWIDLEDQWEKDYYFVVFTDDELFQYMYGLYYPILKDEAIAQHLSKQQVQSLKATLARMRQTKFTSLPENVIPVYRGTRADLEDDTDTYLQLYKRAPKMSYNDGQRLVRQLYMGAFASDNKEPFLRLSGNTKRELELSKALKSESEDERSEDEQSEAEGLTNDQVFEGGAPRKKTKAKADEEQAKKKKAPKGKKGTKKEKKTSKEEPITDTDTVPSQPPSNRLVAFPSDETPLPIEAILHLSAMPHSAIPELYLKERVDYSAPTVQKVIPVEEMDWKKPSSILKAIHTDTRYPLDYVLQQLTELPSLHTLSVHLATYGYALGQLTPEDLKAVQAHLDALHASAALAKHTSSKRYVWNHSPVTGTHPSETSVFVPLKEWLATSVDHLAKKRSAYQERLDLMDKQSDLFTKHPGIAFDIYDLAVRIRQQQIDVEEAIATLASIHKENDLQFYVDFLRDLLKHDADDFDRMGADLALQQALWSQMDASVFPERTSVLREYHSDYVAKPGRPSYLQEDIRPLDAVDEEPEDDGDGNGAGAAEDTEAFETFADAFEPEDMAATGDTVWMAQLPAETEVTRGQRELLVSVGGMLYDLQLKTELPLTLKDAFHFLCTSAPWMTRISQLEQLQEAFPEIPPQDLQVFMEQRMLWYAFESPETEAAFRKKVTEVHQEFKKATLETYIYAVTWWVIVLQDLYIRQPKHIVPSFAPCMPVWAFYGTPMSSSDEKGIARYLVCSSLAIHEGDPENSRWALLRSVPEKKFLDRIYKYSQLAEFTEKVQYLKQQWKERWKEVARKEKELEVRLDVLEKSVGNPKEYLSLYVSIMLRLPTLIQQRDFQKKQTIVAPVANSCCYQPLSLQFQAFSDFKRVGLFEHHRALKQRSTHTQGMGVGSNRLGRVNLTTPIVPGVDSSTFYHETTCREAYSTLAPDAIQDTQGAKELQGVTKHQWNDLCAAIGRRSWGVGAGAGAGEDGDEPIGDRSMTDIRRANQAMDGLIAAYVSKNKRDLDIWRKWLDEGSWEDKLDLLVYLRTQYKKEQNLYGNIEWVQTANERAIEHLTLWLGHLKTWMPGVYPEAPTVLLEFILNAAMMLPSSPEEDLKSIELHDPKWSRFIFERRFELATRRIVSKRVPSNRAIQDYYASVREKLKLDSLAEYKSKTIDEIKELQDAKRLKLKKVFDQSYPIDTATDAQRDDANETEGLAEHRAYAQWNSDDTDIDRLDV